MLVDSHVNLHGERYEEDLEDVFARASEAGVSAMLTISDRLDSTDAIKQVVEGRSNIWRSVGVHPHHAKDYSDLDAQTLIEMTTDPKVIGIGECGLDFHYEYSDRDVQEKVFRSHIEAARETNLPIIIHTRNADEMMADILEQEFQQGDFSILMHCYTSGQALADRALALGAYFAFSGIITFKKADDVRSVAERIPLDRLLLETDCPYLSPVPHRGKRNEPSFLPHVAEKLADVKGVSTDRIAEATTDAFFRLFTKAKKP